MREALAEARRAAELGDVPVGCVIVEDGEIIGRGANEREALADPTAHAEIVALRDAAARKGTWRLDGCVMFVTLEPCPMCAGALVNSRIETLVYGATDPKAGACGTLFSIPTDPRLNHTLEVVPGVLASPCARALTAFFRKLRSSNRSRGPSSGPFGP